ncbi:hypothetical protein [Pseudorhizobium endolithicum]|nr:hypothetical protein [Pseudorhizobium endolithicum]
MSSERQRKPQDWWPGLTLALLLAAFLGLVAGSADSAAPHFAAFPGENTSETPHLSKRDQMRVVVAEARRDGAPAAAGEQGGGLLPRSTMPLADMRGSRPHLVWNTRDPALTSAAPFHPRAPPLLA